MAYNTSKIVGMADATHYLVILTQSLSSAKEVKTFSSISNAKQYLRDQNFDSTTVEYQSAYDEMCGTQPTTPYTEHIKL